MSHNEILVAYLPGNRQYTTKKSLGLIEAQNNDLNATNWRVLRRTSEYLLELLTISVDIQSVERLRKMGFVINIKFGYTTGTANPNLPHLTPQNLVHQVPKQMQ